ncbi:MAG: hypothetical protein II507_08095 [Treponema sp.]|nr:hypothetical protein [Treponema sp.]
MKFRSYLKIIKIYFLLSILSAFVSFVTVIFGSKSLLEMALQYGEVNKEIPKIALYLRGINQTIARIHFQLYTLLICLIIFFIAKNFKLVYGKLREYF